MILTEAHLLGPPVSDFWASNWIPLQMELFCNWAPVLSPMCIGSKKIWISLEVSIRYIFWYILEIYFAVVPSNKILSKPSWMNRWSWIMDIFRRSRMGAMKITVPQDAVIHIMSLWWMWRVLKLPPLRALKRTRSRKWFGDNNNGLHWVDALMFLITRLSVSIFPRVGCGCGKRLVTRICLI